MLWLAGALLSIFLWWVSPEKAKQWVKERLPGVMRPLSFSRSLLQRALPERWKKKPELPPPVPQKPREATRPLVSGGVHTKGEKLPKPEPERTRLVEPQEDSTIISSGRGAPFMRPKPIARHCPICTHPGAAKRLSVSEAYTTYRCANGHEWAEQN